MLEVKTKNESGGFSYVAIFSNADAGAKISQPDVATPVNQNIVRLDVTVVVAEQTKKEENVKCKMIGGRQGKGGGEADRWTKPRR